MSHTPNLHKELALLSQGYYFVAGLDEAGRGAWAGPVVAAAVILPLTSASLTETLVGLRDSKKLTANQREHLFKRITTVAVAIRVGIAPSQLVDQLNVVAATRHAMQ